MRPLAESSAGSRRAATTRLLGRRAPRGRLMRGRLGIGTEWVVDHHFLFRHGTLKPCGEIIPGRLVHAYVRSPLPRVEVSRAGVGCEAQGWSEAFHLQRREASTQSSPDRELSTKRVRQEAPVQLRVVSRDERLSAAVEAQHRGIDARRRREGRSGKAAGDGHVVPGPPVGALEQCAGRRLRASRRSPIARSRPLS